MREQLRKAGRKIVEWDKGYANKVGRFIGGDPAERKDGWVGVARGGLGGVARSQYGEAGLEFDKPPGFWGKAADKAVGIGVPTAGLGIRYGIPAAGVALAGKGLMDLTAQLNSNYGGKADEQTPSQLQIEDEESSNFKGISLLDAIMIGGAGVMLGEMDADISNDVYDDVLRDDDLYTQKRRSRRSN